MKIIIKETSAIETLSIIDPKSGFDYIYDLIGNTGALSDGQFVWNEDRNAYVCTQETFDWWYAVVTAHQSLDNRIHKLVQEHDSETVIRAGSVDLVDLVGLAYLAMNVNQALDEAFGSAE